MAVTDDGINVFSVMARPLGPYKAAGGIALYSINIANTCSTRHLTAWYSVSLINHRPAPTSHPNPHPEPPGLPSENPSLPSENPSLPPQPPGFLLSVWEARRLRTDFLMHPPGAFARVFSGASSGASSGVTRMHFSCTQKVCGCQTVTRLGVRGAGCFSCLSVFTDVT